MVCVLASVAPPLTSHLDTFLMLFTVICVGSLWLDIRLWGGGLEGGGRGLEGGGGLEGEEGGGR